MQVSAEVRWFWRDALPPSVEPWFRSRAFPPGGGSPREDEYLVDAGQVELGVKKRGGKQGIEIKGLVSVADAPLPQPFAGRAQIWSKWSSAALTIDHLPRITVGKVRWLRKYDTGGPDVRELELDAQERLRDSSAELPAHGCQLELVALTVLGDGSRWWTLGFEAFGPLGNVERSLRQAIVHVSRTPPPPLGGGRELSYPQWLSTLKKA